MADKKLIGYKSKKLGSLFESIFQHQAERRGWEVLRIEDGHRTIKTNLGLKAIKVRNPCDFVIFKNQKVIFIDVKHTSKEKINIASFLAEPSNKHQFNVLKKLKKHFIDGFFVVYFLKDRSVPKPVVVTTEFLESTSKSFRNSDLFSLDSFLGGLKA